MKKEKEIEIITSAMLERMIKGKTDFILYEAKYTNEGGVGVVAFRFPKGLNMDLNKVHFEVRDGKPIFYNPSPIMTQTLGTIKNKKK
jgi:hypothetical protein